VSIAKRPYLKSESPAGHVNWLELNRSPHAVHFYSSEDFLVDSLSRFVGAALEAGDSSFVFATRAHLDGLTDALKKTGIDTDRAIKGGRYLTFDAVQALGQLTVAGKLDKTRFDDFVRRVVLPLKAAAESKPQRVAACGEIVALLWAEGKAEAAIELEHLWNELAEQGAYSFRCFYPVASFSDPGQSDLFMRLCAKHASVIPGDCDPAPSVEREQERLQRLSARVTQFETRGMVA
jgi:MEDS: MEthanogen/methylotroph, DcmR Sensory domain